MKKRTFLFTLLIVILVFAGCGKKKDEPSLEDSFSKAIKEQEDLISTEDESEAQEDTDDAKSSDGSDETESSEDAEDSGDEDAQTSKSDAFGAEQDKASEDWLASNGLEITKQSDFDSFTTAVHPPKKRETIGEMKFPATISIKETTDGCDEGYKKIVIKLEIDPSPSGSNGFTFFSAPLDRYTGTEFREPMGETGLEMTTRTHSVEGHEYLTFMSNGESIDIDKTCVNEMVGKKHVEMTTVVCPEDYDGTIFSVGYYDYDLEDESDASGTAERVHRMDETPFFGTNGHKYYYFSYTDE